jgi:hypothetical protein
MISSSPGVLGSPAPTGSGRDLSAYRKSEREQARIAALFELMPDGGETALDVGARDGFVSLLLADRFQKVCALDLVRPNLEHQSVECVQGDICRLDFPDNSFDLVLCAEVLEHIPPARLRRACDELARVTRRHLLIGVPFDQDIRLGRTLCRACGRRNPPWGHVNVFDENRLELLFPDLTVERIRYVGETRDRTTALAAWLDDRAGNPDGTYDQEEACVHCGASLPSPSPDRGFPRRLCRAASHWLNRAQRAFARPRPIWIHMAYSKAP